MLVGIFYKPKRTRNANLFLAYNYIQWSRVIKHRGYGEFPIARRYASEEEFTWANSFSRFRGYYYDSWENLLLDENEMGAPRSYLEELEQIAPRYPTLPLPEKYQKTQHATTKKAPQSGQLKLFTEEVIPLR